MGKWPGLCSNLLRLTPSHTAYCSWASVSPCVTGVWADALRQREQVMRGWGKKRMKPDARCPSHPVPGAQPGACSEV